MLNVASAGGTSRDIVRDHAVTRRAALNRELRGGFFEDLVQAAFDSDPLASQPVALNGHEHGTQSFDLVQEPVDQADWVQHCRTHAPQAFCYLIDHRAPSVSMTSLCDMNVRNREAESE
jgi:hypothetical protein